MLTKKQIFYLLLILFLFIALSLSLLLVSQRQEIRKEAGSSTATLTLYPTSETFNFNEPKALSLVATFSGGTSSEKLDYFKTELSFSNDYLRIPPGRYIDTSLSGLGRIFKVDGPTVANEKGKIIIETGTISPREGPSLDKPITLAKIYFEGKNQTTSVQEITIGNTQLVNNQSATIPLTTQGTTYTVVISPTIEATPTITEPSVTPLATSSPTLPSSTPTPSPTATLTPSVSPFVTLSPTPVVEPTFIPSPTSFCPQRAAGDANCDGNIDGIDYSIWLRSQCYPTQDQVCADTRADFNNDGRIDEEDFRSWLYGRHT